MDSASQHPSRPVLRLVAISLVLLAASFWAFAVGLGTANAVVGAYKDMRKDVAVNNDFPMFYAGADNVVSGDRGKAYEKDFIVESIRSGWNDPESEKAQELVPWLRYYNPPFFLFALSPLTQMELHHAYVVVVVVNLILLSILLYLVGVMLKWRQPLTAIVMISALGLMSVPQSVYHGQPTILIAILVTAAFLATQSGRTVLASVLIAFSAAKPQYAFAAGLPLVRSNWKAALPLAVAGAALTLLPFIALGAGALLDYIHLVLGRGSDDLNSAEYSTHVLSWPGFWVALTGSVQPELSIVATLLSLAIGALVLRQGDRHLSWAGSMLCALIVVPHSHPQDWMLAIPVAAILLARPMASQLRWVTISLLVSGYVATNTWVLASDIAYDGGRSFYAAPIFGFALLIWCAVIPLLERQETDKVALPVAGPETAFAK